MPLYLVTAPSVPVISLDDMKQHLRVTHSTEDDLIELYTAAATSRLDGRDGLLNRALMAQTWDYKIERFATYDCWQSQYGIEFQRQHYNAAMSAGSVIVLPLPPLISVDSVKYIDSDGNEQTFDASNYHVVGIGGGQPARLQLRSGKSWPSSLSTSWPEPIAIRLTAGYSDTSDSPPTGEVPPPIVQGIKLIVGHHFANRESVVVGSTAFEVPQSAMWLLEPFKVFV